MYNNIPYIELENRINNFKKDMSDKNPKWEIALIFTKVNQFYFTGTMQDGFLVLTNGIEDIYFVRRSYERAIDESNFKKIVKAKSIRTIKEHYKKDFSEIYTETSKIPIDFGNMIKKYYPNASINSCDSSINTVREIKSPLEIDKIKKSGKIHSKVLEKILPNLIEEGITEERLALKVYEELINNGHHGIARFSMFDTEMLFGQIGFGENSSFPSYFNGPGGNKGISPAVPLSGSRSGMLKKGDLIFVDIACGFEGYHTDKTVVFYYGKKVPEELQESHLKCIEIEKKIAKLLQPGNIPAEIYTKIYDELDEEFKNNFMGENNRVVKFLGHGVGLVVDEYPVIAKKYTEPLKENMVIAIEPKKVIKGFGTVGIENTYIVKNGGGECITGNSNKILPISI